MHPSALFILYVEDQQKSRKFYEAVLGYAPRLDVPGMTEFDLPGGGAVLGLMPEEGIVRLLGGEIQHPALARRVPRAELYLYVSHPVTQHVRALEAGARELSPPSDRDWGDFVAYSADPDGHILAFARKS